MKIKIKKIYKNMLRQKEKIIIIFQLVLWNLLVIQVVVVHLINKIIIKINHISNNNNNFYNNSNNN